MRQRDAGGWATRFVKGMFIGSGFILPGVSGGALAAVFGVYERLIGFLAHPTRDFKRDLLFLMPVGLGGACGVFFLSFAVSYFLEAYEVQVLWFFIGCILGTVPMLWKQAGRKGRTPLHLAVMVSAAIWGYVLLLLGKHASTGALPRNPATWLLSGGVIGLGVVVPGLSPSNFLIYLGMYKPMTDGIKALDPAVIIPLGAGMIAVVLTLSKVMDALFARAYAGLFHFILGMVAASTAMIIPQGVDYLGADAVVCAAALAGGAALGCRMSSLETAHKGI